MKKLLFGFSIIFGWHEHTYSMQEAQLKEVQQHIVGDLIVVPDKGLRYAGYDYTDVRNKKSVQSLMKHIHDEQGNKLVLRPQDILVEFWALSQTDIDRLRVSATEYVPWFLP